MLQVRDILFFSHQSLIAATPLVIAGAGELVAERSGVINIGIEGMMLMGCFSAYVTAVATGSGVCGLLAAIGTGVILAGLFAIVTIWLRADQIVSGTAMNLLAAGISATAWGAFNSPLAHSVPQPEPRLSPYIMVISAAILCAGILAMFRLTRKGLIIRALGDSPDSCSAAGIRVLWWRTGCVLFGGACAGAAGAYLSIMRIFQFSPDQTGGIGFLVLALVIFGRWNMLGLVAGCFLFGFTDVLQRYGQGASTSQHTHEDLFRMLPYVATLAVLAILTRTKAAQKHLGRPWPEE